MKLLRPQHRMFNDTNSTRRCAGVPSQADWLLVVADDSGHCWLLGRRASLRSPGVGTHLLSSRPLTGRRPLLWTTPRGSRGSCVRCFLILSASHNQRQQLTSSGDQRFGIVNLDFTKKLPIDNTNTPIRSHWTYWRMDSNFTTSLL